VKPETAAIFLSLIVLAGSIFSSVSALTPYTWRERDYFVYEIVVNKQVFLYRFEVLEVTSEQTKVRLTIRESGLLLYENTFRIRHGGEKVGEYDPTHIAEDAGRGTLKVVSFTINGEAKDVQIREWESEGMTIWVSEDAGILLKAESKVFAMTLIETNVEVPVATSPATGTGGIQIPGFSFEAILIGLAVGMIAILATHRVHPVATHACDRPVRAYE